MRVYADKRRFGITASVLSVLPLFAGVFASHGFLIHSHDHRTTHVHLIPVAHPSGSSGHARAPVAFHIRDHAITKALAGSECRPVEGAVAGLSGDTGHALVDLDIGPVLVRSRFVPGGSPSFPGRNMEHLLTPAIPASERDDLISFVLQGRTAAARSGARTLVATRSTLLI